MELLKWLVSVFFKPFDFVANEMKKRSRMVRQFERVLNRIIDVIFQIFDELAAAILRKVREMKQQPQEEEWKKRQREKEEAVIKEQFGCLVQISIIIVILVAAVTDGPRLLNELAGQPLVWLIGAGLVILIVGKMNDSI